MKGNGNLKIVRLKTKNGIPENFVSLDTVITDRIIKAMGANGTYFINGVSGVVENPAFRQGTMDMLNLLREIKSVNPGVKIFGGGGDFGIEAYRMLGEKGVQENFDGILTMGGALLELLSSGELSAMDFIDRKFPREKVNGIFNYGSFLTNITDVPFSFWEDKIVNLIVDLNIGDTSGFDAPDKIELSEMQKVTGIIDSLAYLLKMGVRKIRIFSHDGRYKDYMLPKDAPSGTVDPRYSLKNLALIITVLLHKKGVLGENEKVDFVSDCLLEYSGISRIVLFENTRFYREESANNPEFTQRLLATHPADCAINDAAGALHRGKECSKGKFIGDINGPRAIGFLVTKELGMVSDVFLHNPRKPIVGIFQGNKNDKISAMKLLAANKIVDRMIVTGGIYSLFTNGDKDAKEVLRIAKINNVPIVLPDEVVAAQIPPNMSKENFIKQIKANQI